MTGIRNAKQGPSCGVDNVSEMGIGQNRLKPKHREPKELWFQPSSYLANTWPIPGQYLAHAHKLAYIQSEWTERLAALFL